MPGLPEVTVIGTLTADPEIRYVTTGDAVANFTLASNDRRYDPERGEWVDASATFLRCSIWRQAAEHVCESLRRGDRVVATGALKQRSWETDQGERRTAYELAVTEIGPSLKFATATVKKAARSTGNRTGTAGSSASAEDVWSRPAPGGTGSGAASDEPPF